LAAAMLGIPLVLQEQNAWPGATTRLLSRWAAQVHVAFPEAAPHLPAGAQQAIHVSGCPIRPLPLQSPDRDEVCARFGLDSALNVLVVVGGSQGSKALNDVVLGAVATHSEGSQIEGWQVLWATGPAHYSDVDAALAGSKTSVPVQAVPYIEDIPSALSIADLAVSRAGAMTTSELLAWGVPAILVPLPTAAANHQELNAQALEEAGAAVHLPQADVSSELLWDQIVGLAEDQDRLKTMSRSARDRSRPEATSEIVTEMMRLLPKQREAST